jgi:hypothetical protein
MMILVCPITLSSIDAFSNSLLLHSQLRTKRVFHGQLNNEDNLNFISLDDEELDEATLAEIEAGKPSNWMVIQRVRYEYFTEFRYQHRVD